MKQKILLVLSTCLTLSLQAQQVMNMSLKDCMEYAVKNQPNVKNLKFEEALQQLKNDELTGLTRPQANFSGGVSGFIQVPKSRSDGSLFNFSPDPPPRYNVFQFALPYNSNCTLSVSQLLFDPNVFIALDARKSIMELTRANTAVTEVNTKYNVAKAYYNTIIAEKRVASLTNNIALVKDFYNMTSKLFTEGFAEKIDADRLQVQLNNLEVEKNKIENLIAISYQLLKFNMGMPLSQPIFLTDDLDIEKIKSNVLAENVTYENRAEMQQLSIAKHLQGLDVKRQKNSNLPTVAAFGSYGLGSSTLSFSDLFTYKYYPQSLLGLQVNLPLYTGGQRQNKIKQAQLKIDQLDNTKAIVQQGIDLEYANAKTQLKNSLLSLDNQNKNVELAQRVLNTTQKKYKEGLGSAIEVMQAQTAYKDAQTNYLSSMFEVTSANIDLQKALGNIK